MNLYDQCSSKYDEKRSAKNIYIIWYNITISIMYVHMHISMKSKIHEQFSLKCIVVEVAVAK